LTSFSYSLWLSSALVVIILVNPERRLFIIFFDYRLFVMLPLPVMAVGKEWMLLLVVLIYMNYQTRTLFISSCFYVTVVKQRMFWQSL